VKFAHLGGHPEINLAERLKNTDTQQQTTAVQTVIPSEMKQEILDMAIRAYSIANY